MFKESIGLRNAVVRVIMKIRGLGKMGMCDRVK